VTGGPVIQNFRGVRALVVHPADANRDVLVATLRRLGLLVATAEPGTDAPRGADGFDLVFFDADEGPAGATLPQPEAVALVALIGSEAPGRLGRVVRQRCAAHLMKPVKASGVFAAVFLAMNEFAARQREAREREALAQRLAGRRLVTKAILAMMAGDGIDDDEAYRRLRRDSMRRRLPIEQIAQERLDANAAGIPDAPASEEVSRLNRR
jgi:AmiR/NasT family two-component response regulator